MFLVEFCTSGHSVSKPPFSSLLYLFICNTRARSDKEWMSFPSLSASRRVQANQNEKKNAFSNENVLMWTRSLKCLPFLVHKVTHTKQSSISAHLSEVTSWEAVSLFGNFTKVHSRLHLQKMRKYSLSICNFQ